MAGRMIYQRVKQILAVIYNLAQHVLTKIKQKVNSQTTLWFLFSENVKCFLCVPLSPSKIFCTCFKRDDNFAVNSVFSLTIELGNNDHANRLAEAATNRSVTPFHTLFGLVDVFHAQPRSITPSNGSVLNSKRGSWIVEWLSQLVFELQETVTYAVSKGLGATFLFCLEHNIYAQLYFKMLMTWNASTKACRK